MCRRDDRMRDNAAISQIYPPLQDESDGKKRAGDEEIHHHKHQSQENELDVSKKLKLKLFVPIIDQPIDLIVRVIWQAKISLEDNSPFDVGVEIMDICEENKNIFLKYLCDLLYGSTYEFRT